MAFGLDMCDFGKTFSGKMEFNEWNLSTEGHLEMEDISACFLRTAIVADREIH